MKKNINKAIAILLIFIFILLSGCSNTNAANTFTPNFLENSLPMVKNISSESNQKFPDGTAISSELHNELQELYEELCTYYGIQKSLPRIVQLSAEQFNDIVADGSELMQGCYNSSTKTLYIRDGIKLSNPENREIVTHEFLHYLSDNGEKRGFIYFSDDGTKEFNRYFNEGATEFLAIKFFGNLVNNENSPYALQKLLSAQISTVVGFDEFKHAYFNSDDSQIRKAFNDSVSDLYPGQNLEGTEFDPWDEICGNCYTMWAMDMLSTSDSDNEYLLAEYAIFAYSQEEIIYFAEKNNCTEEVKKLTKQLFIEDWGIDTPSLDALFSYSYLMKLFS